MVRVNLNVFFYHNQSKMAFTYVPLQKVLNLEFYGDCFLNISCYASIFKSLADDKITHTTVRLSITPYVI
jgi:hypothetical protein